MGRPTDNDWTVFSSDSMGNKVEVLYNYLCLGNGNMQEIAYRIYGSYNGHEAQRVSVITRCYGFEGNNSGIYRKWNVTRADIVAFVKRYPNGCEYDGGRTMSEFLRKRIQGRQVVNSGDTYKQYSNTEYSNMPISSKKEADLDDKMLLVYYLPPLILLILFNLFVISCAWYVNLILFFVVAGVWITYIGPKIGSDM